VLTSVERIETWMADFDELNQRVGASVELVETRTADFDELNQRHRPPVDPVETDFDKLNQRSGPLVEPVETRTPDFDKLNQRGGASVESVQIRPADFASTISEGIRRSSLSRPGSGSVRATDVSRETTLSVVAMFAGGRRKNANRAMGRHWRHVFDCPARTNQRFYRGFWAKNWPLRAIVRPLPRVTPAPYARRAVRIGINSLLCGLKSAWIGVRCSISSPGHVPFFESCHSMGGHWSGGDTSTAQQIEHRQSTET
jgi:hypothetical protein